MKRGFAPTIFMLLAGLFALGAAPLAAQLQNEAGFIPVDGSVSYFHVGSFFNRIPLPTSPARMWYVFQPADEAPEAKPLFVLFNGGPGGATSCGLLATFTGRNAVWRDEATGEAAIVANPSSWTGLGNLLYIDSRTAGFSYSLMDRPGDAILRGREFDAQNYNPFVDGADFVRVLLRFLADHPSIRRNGVVLVPESYGGIRTTVMLNLLLYYERYADGTSIFQDPDLVGKIRAHYDAVFPEYAGRAVPPGAIAGQFGHQVLIQTALTWPYQRSVAAAMLEAPGSPLYQVAAETGVPYVPYAESPGAAPNPTPAVIFTYIYGWLDSVGRDPYHMGKPANFLDGHRAATAELLSQIGTLNLLAGIDVRSVEAMYATARAQAYTMKIAGSGAGGTAASPVETMSRSRLADGKRTSEGRLAYPVILPAGRRTSATRQGISRDTLDLSALVGPPPAAQKLAVWRSPAGESELAGVFGNLQPWDSFLIDLNYDVSTAFAYNKVTLRSYPVSYTSSAVYGRMFLENAAWVETFATDSAWDSVVYSPALPGALAMHTDVLSGAQLDDAGPPGAARPGQIFLTYRLSTVPGSTVTSRTIRFPRYLMSGHAVTMTEPQEILEDVTAWMAATGARVRDRARAGR
jgi:hypothetical protein